MKKNFPKFFNKQCFYLLIGDDGLLFLKIGEKNLEYREFINLPTDDKMADIINILSSHPNTPIMIYLDISEQNYQIQTFPPVGSLTIKNLVNKRLEKEGSSDDFKVALPFSKSKKNAYSSNYVFGICQKSDIDKWLDALKSIPNLINSVYLLPVEYENVLSQINRHFQSASKIPQQLSEWQLLVVFNRVSGIRQTVFQNGRIIFTRVVSPGTDYSPDVLAGNIEQEIQSLYEYFQRSYMKNNKSLDVFIIVNSAIKKYLQRGDKIYKIFLVFNPSEILANLNLDYSDVAQDNFADTTAILAAKNQNPVKKFAFTIDLSSYYLIYFNRFMITFSILFCLYFLTYTFIDLYHIYDNTDKVDQLTLENNNLKNKISQIEKSAGMTSQESDSLYKVMQIYKIMAGNNLSPFDILKKTLSVKNENISINDFTWLYIEKTDPQKSKTPDNTINSTINLNYSNHSNSYENLFIAFDQFITDIKKVFGQYNIEYTRINQQVTFDSFQNNIPISIKISGPK